MSAWRRPSRCDTNKCVEFRDAGEHVMVRSTTDPTKRVVFTPEEWRDFIAAAKNGEYDV